MDDKKQQEEIYSKTVRAGKRTYFFDVRATRNDDYYLTITESKKFFNEDGTSHYKKHKIFLYKEDFEKFQDAFTETLDFIIDKKGKYVREENNIDDSNNKDGKFTDVKFEDL
ncbi:MAG: DNA-binding protein [Flavobacteriales bacterium]|mgnify:FL=1|nr:DNA-binding protein [Flavobacteriales bacterium]